MAKDSICWCFGPHSYLNQIKFPFSAYMKSFKTLFQKDAVLSNFRQFSALNFEKNCQAKLNLIWKDEHVNFEGA